MAPPIIFLIVVVVIVVGIGLTSGWFAELMHRPGTGEQRPVNPHGDERSRPEHAAVTSETIENTTLGGSERTTPERSA